MPGDLAANARHDTQEAIRDRGAAMCHGTREVRLVRRWPFEDGQQVFGVVLADRQAPFLKRSGGTPEDVSISVMIHSDEHVAPRALWQVD